MTPHEFVKKWQNSRLKERAAAQEHFIDLCRMLNEKTPAEVDASGQNYAFEVGATKTTGGRGFADVFKREHFGWEYKGTHGNLDAAFAQLQRYAVALDNPPLLIVSDIGTTIRIHTNWTNSISQTYVIPIADLGDAERRGWLKAAFTDPDALRPKKTRQELTEEVAGDFAELARSLRTRGHPAEEVAHFVNKLVFCMFAEDVKLLPDTMFTRMLDRAIDDPAEFEDFARTLFAAMKTGGRVGFEKVAWFNGGLFNDDRVFALTKDEIKIVRRAAEQYWGDIDPSILGTLFERGLDPDKRSQLGAHYTDRDKIMMIINPVVVEPLAAEWETAKVEIASLIGKAQQFDANAKTKGGRSASAAIGQATVARRDAQNVLDRHLKRLADFRVLDPACGSGNFLYIALRELKDLEHRAQVEAETMGLPRRFPTIGPEVVKGIEINSYAAELARVSVWIGEIQWMLKNGFPAAQNPVLKPLENIECRDALLSQTTAGEWIEASWPQADVIIGNPPFVGDKKLGKLFDPDALKRVRAVYLESVKPSANLVSYWFYKAGKELKGETNLVGFVATQAIRRGASRSVVQSLIDDGAEIFDAWANEPWNQDGADVRVSILCLRKNEAALNRRLNGIPSNTISADLNADIAQIRPVVLLENRKIAGQGTISGGPFEIPPATAREMLKLPLNPNNQSNASVIRPWRNADDLSGRPSDWWIIDFGSTRSEKDAALFEKPFQHLKQEWEKAQAARRAAGEKLLRAGEPKMAARWWVFQRRRDGLLRDLSNQKRYLVTPRVSKHRFFVWLHSSVVPDTRLVAFRREDDAFAGILQSKHHEIWSLRFGGNHGVGNDPEYLHTSTFETFPFPVGLTPDVPLTDLTAKPEAAAIGAAFARLSDLRNNWLNPADNIRIEDEVTPGLPKRILPVSAGAAEVLQKRTLTNLYNERPSWLVDAHDDLDKAVAAAYSWAADISDSDILARLFALNQERAKA